MVTTTGCAPSVSLELKARVTPGGFSRKQFTFLGEFLQIKPSNYCLGKGSGKGLMLFMSFLNFFFFLFQIIRSWKVQKSTAHFTWPN